jgi:hypothetical protein
MERPRELDRERERDCGWSGCALVKYDPTAAAGAAAPRAESRRVRVGGVGGIWLGRSCMDLICGWGWAVGGLATASEYWLVEDVLEVSESWARESTSVPVWESRVQDLPDSRLLLSLLW